MKNLSNTELVNQYKIAKKNFIQATEGTQQEIEADKIVTELFAEIKDRDLDLRDYQATKKELNLVIGEKYTVLETMDLLPTRIYGTLKGYYYSNFAQHENALYIYIQRPRCKKINRIVLTTDTFYIFKGDFKECWNKVPNWKGNARMTELKRFTYEDLKDNENLVYSFQGRTEKFIINNDFEGLLDNTGDFIYNNGIKPIEAPENESYINYIRSLLTRCNVNDLLKYIKIEGYNMLEKSINKAVEYSW